jgi:hypothetical protein
MGLNLYAQTPHHGEWYGDWAVARVNIVRAEAKANARLIAAAPDLLEALESAWLWMENQADGQSKGGHATFDLLMLREQRDIARAAIAKATGEQ